MNKRLQDVRASLDAVRAPDDFEKRISSAIESVPKRNKRRHFRVYVAVAVFAFVLGFLYQYPAFAYYSKQLFGFDEVMSETIRDLNEAGYGQVVGESGVLLDGTKVTIDGVMADANQFLLFYTVDDANWDSSFVELNGFFVNRYAQSQVGLAADDASGWKYIARFEPVHGFAKKLTVSFGALGDITFPYKANEALESSRKVAIREGVRTDIGKVTFDSLVASPTQTVISGKLSLEMARHFLGENIHLLANGELVEQQGSSVTTNIFSSFTLAYDALPEKLESLEIVVDALPERVQVNQTIDLSAGPASLGVHELEIVDLREVNGDVHLDIVTADELFLENIYALGPVKEVELTRTIDSFVRDDGKKQRTLVFENVSSNEVMHLSVESVQWMKDVQETISIPVQ